MKITIRPALKLFLLPILLVGIFFATTNVTHAQSNYPSYNQYNTEPNVPSNNRTRIQTTVIDLMGTTYCLLIGVDPMSAQPCLGINPATQKIGYVTDNASGGAIAFMGEQIGTLYHPPASSIEYIKSIASNFGIVKNANAQGFGADNLSPFITIFEITRNIAYMALVILFVIIGMAIMLRIKIDPRTVMSIQNQIPKVIVGIVLITFSYAISGLLIDLMWVGTYVGVNTLTADSIAGKEKITTEQATKNLLDSPLGYLSSTLGFFETAKDTGVSIGGIVSEIILTAIKIEPRENCKFWQVTCKGEDALYGLVRGILQGLGILIVIIALFITLIRIWFMLLKAYAYIVLDIILAPLWIIAGLIPGSSLGFGAWIRHISAHLILFPATVMMILLAGVLIEIFNLDQVRDGTVFLPPLIGTSEIGNELGTLVALGMIFLIPELLNILRDALKSPASKYSGSFAAGIGTGVGATIGAAKGTTGVYMGSKEVLLKKGGGAEERGLTKSILGRLTH